MSTALSSSPRHLRRGRSEANALRAWFERLGSNRGDATPRVLERLALSVAANTPSARRADVAEEVVSEYHWRLVSAIHRGERPIDELLALPDANLLAKVRKSLRCLVAEHDPRRTQRRYLHDHVKRALARALPQVDEAPHAIERRGAFCGEEVARAVAWHLSQPCPPKRDARALTSALLDHYCPRAELDGERPTLEMAAVCEEPTRWMEASRTVARIRSRLTERQFRVLFMRLNGDTFQEIANATGMGLSTVHGHFRCAERIARAVAGLIAPLASRS